MHHLTKYPYADMTIDGKVTLCFNTKGEAVKARIAAHSYGGYADKRFRTHINGVNLEVRRVV